MGVEDQVLGLEEAQHSSGLAGVAKEAWWCGYRSVGQVAFLGASGGLTGSTGQHGRKVQGLSGFPLWYNFIRY